MQKLKMKVVGYEAGSGSILVSFASDTTQSNNPSDYQALAYQPVNMWPDVTDIEIIKRNIAISGMHQAEMQEKHENFKKNSEQLAAIESLVGQEFEYEVSDLLSPAPSESIVEL